MDITINNFKNLIHVIAMNGLKYWDEYGLDVYDEEISLELDRSQHQQALSLKYAIKHRQNIINKPGGNQLIQYTANKIINNN
jgi:hypothetical protein